MPSFQWAVALEVEGGDSSQQLLQDEERLGTELVGSPAPAGSRAAGIDVATAQEGIAAFSASVWEGVAEAPACPHVQWQTQCRVSWKGLQRLIL